MTPDLLTAIVPMRRDSKRVPGKNTRPLGGKPLYHHIIEALIQSESVGDIVVDTDSEELEQDLARHFPTVRTVSRPAFLADDMASAHEILRNTVTQIAGDHFLQTHSTNPLLTAGTLDAASRAYFAARPENDSLFSVTPVYKRFYTTSARPVNHDPLQIVRTQDLDPLLEENSCIYMFDRETILQQRSRIGKHPLLFQTPPEESVDIDNELDLVIADAVYHGKGSADGLGRGDEGAGTHT